MTVTLDTTSLYSGQGFNVQDIVNQILDSERGQETQWKNEQTTLQSQTTALDQLQSRDLDAVHGCEQLKRFLRRDGSSLRVPRT